MVPSPWVTTTRIIHHDVLASYTCNNRGDMAVVLRWLFVMGIIRIPNVMVIVCWDDASCSHDHFHMGPFRLRGLVSAPSTK
jgi:hypothetical protein